MTRNPQSTRGQPLPIEIRAHLATIAAVNRIDTAVVHGLHCDDLAACRGLPNAVLRGLAARSELRPDDGSRDTTTWLLQARGVRRLRPGAAVADMPGSRHRVPVVLSQEGREGHPATGDNTGALRMIDALIAGRLAADPKPGTSRNGNAYATARVLVTINAEDRLSVSVIAFDAATVAALLAMESGDAIALAGELTPKVWKDKDGNAQPSADMKAHALLTPYHVSRKRKAAQSDE